MDETTATLWGPIALSRAVVRHALAADVPFMAGTIAYQAFVSLMPLLFLLVVVTTTVGGTKLTGQFLSITVGQLPVDAQSMVRNAVLNAVERTGNSVVGVVVLGFGAFAVFNGSTRPSTTCTASTGVPRSRTRFGTRSWYSRRSAGRSSSSP